ncbi:hypothetical protein [Streptomyces sp. NPDC057403]|uniref:hypothetical protein n=1 Tax=Streptomyces sp. NPDC057403 TaxID=3346119 RepID=UPI0036805161
MDAKIWAALIGGAATLIVYVAGLFTTFLKERATRRASARDKARVAAKDLLNAALDLKVALNIVENRRRDRRSLAAPLARSIAQLIAGYHEDRKYTGIADGLGSALAWRGSADAAEEALLMGPLSRVTAAAAQAAFLDDDELRAATAAVTEALGKLMSTPAGRRHSVARAQADREVDEAIGRLSSAARAYTGKKRRRAALTTA